MGRYDVAEGTSSWKRTSHVSTWNSIDTKTRSTPKTQTAQWHDTKSRPCPSHSPPPTIFYLGTNPRHERCRRERQQIKWGFTRTGVELRLTKTARPTYSPRASTSCMLMPRMGCATGTPLQEACHELFYARPAQRRPSPT